MKTIKWESQFGEESMFIDKEDILEHLLKHKALMNYVNNIATEVFKIRELDTMIHKGTMVHNVPYSISTGNPEIDADNISYEWTGYSYDEHEDKTMEFPTRYLWTDDWKEQEKKAVEEEKQKEKARQEAIKQRDAERQRKKDEEEFEKLKKKLGVV